MTRWAIQEYPDTAPSTVMFQQVVHQDRSVKLELPHFRITEKAHRMNSHTVAPQPFDALSQLTIDGTARSHGPGSLIDQAI